MVNSCARQSQHTQCVSVLSGARLGRSPTVAPPAAPGCSGKHRQAATEVDKPEPLKYLAPARDRGG